MSHVSKIENFTMEVINLDNETHRFLYFIWYKMAMLDYAIGYETSEESQEESQEKPLED